jgi:TRAP-type C4-dicarboxylate transport system permease small subunit
MDTRSVIAKWLAGTVILFLAVVALGAPFGLVIWLKYAQVPNVLQLPLLAIASVSVLFASLALVSISFATFELSDKTQSLGLPDGSIRAFIALALVVVFAIVAFSVYGDLATPVDAGKVHDPAAVDFAKQLLTLTGTLVTAVASFYFGAKTATSAQAATQTNPAPVLRSINPAVHSIAANGSTLNLKIAGDGLDLIKEVKIVKGNDQIVASSVHSNASEVSCQIPLQANSTGLWDVIVTDGTGKQAKLPGALTIS